MFKSYFTDFLSLIFPVLCQACGASLHNTETPICTNCLFNLPRTWYHMLPQAQNPVAKTFWGRVPLRNASAYYRFTKSGKVQHLLHALKYNGRQDVGHTIGRFYGADLAADKNYQSIDAIVPLPLHPARQRKRGYNQAQAFADGLATQLRVSVLPHACARAKHTTTQTDKGRYDRWTNTQGIFEVKNPQALTGKHILLVDDVITTGATIEACAQAILQVPNTTLSVAAIAYAQI